MQQEIEKIKETDETRMCTNNYLLIKGILPKNEQDNGLVLPDQALPKMNFGFIIGVGEGLSDIYGNSYSPDFEIGDLVYFTQHAPEKIDYTPEGLEVLYMIGEGDVYVKIRPCADGDVEIIPMGNYIHIEPLEDSVQKVTPGGIILPDQSVERPSKAKVLGVGRGQKTANNEFFAPRVRVGDIVRYRSFSNFEIRLDDLGIGKKPQYIVTYGDIYLIETENYKELLRERLEMVKDIHNNIREVQNN